MERSFHGVLKKELSAISPVKTGFIILFIYLIQVQTSAQKYFQQEVNYTISVRLNDRNNQLSASERVEYINNSPDTLRLLYFHLWPNGYSSNKTALGKELISRNGKMKLFEDPANRGYIDSLDFRCHNIKIKWALLDESPDICVLTPDHPVNPGDTIIISTPFHVKIPQGGISRLGHTGQSYQISQWYPKPAVYDRNGWHQMSYLDQGEFYSEFGNFDVSITLPENYTVGATGDLQNKAERDRLETIAADTSWMRIPDYITDFFPPSSARFKTLRYTHSNIHDFAWFADKRFHVLRGQVKLAESGRIITTWCMFTNIEAYLWRKSISYVNNALRTFSIWNGDYPYDSFTAVQSTLSSGDGMEYPGLTVITQTGDEYLLEDVLAHEICHSWFYSALGSDERRFPFMDESITTANESRFMNMRYPEKKLWEINLKNRSFARLIKAENIPASRIGELEWLVPARLNLEQQLNLSADKFTEENYGNIIYSKAAIGFNFLRSYLRDSVYDAAMHDYYFTWSGKHPSPEDLRAIFEAHTEKDLNWFFDDFLGTTKRLDYKLARIKNNRILIRNKGELDAPLEISFFRGNSLVSEKWAPGFNGKKWISTGDISFSEAIIDPGHKSPELYRLNNNLRPTGLFRKYDPVLLRLLYTVEDPGNRYLIFFPAVNWNNDDGFMAGLILHNGGGIPKPAEYFIMPFYAFRNRSFTGYGRITINAIPYNNAIRLASISVEGERFGAPGIQNYYLLKTGADIYLRSKIKYPEQKLFAYYFAASDLGQIESEVKAKMRSFIVTGYNLQRRTIINPYNLRIQVEAGKSYQKASLEVKYSYTYPGITNGLEARIFAGTMIEDRNPAAFYSLSSSGRRGSGQYFYEGVFPGRFNENHGSFFSRQMALTEGGLVSGINDSLGYSRWLCSVSLTSSLPGKASVIPVRPFFNVLLNDHGYDSGKPAVFIEGGLKAGIWNVFEVYFPFVVSDNIKTITGSFKDRIRFIFRIEIFNPFGGKTKLP